MNGTANQGCIEQYGSAFCMEAQLAGMTPEQYAAELQRQQQIQQYADPGMYGQGDGAVQGAVAGTPQPTARPIVYGMAGMAAGIVVGVIGATVFYALGKVL